jgi:GalNAc-alpha-(1->4)-GalNAc-alpha-(1->3)-diNAcBac-PP-undecaprenol alpha-1,4-N-acetyl-D-galactosaminyltransferase
MILFVIYSLGRGGAERVVVRMANYWAGIGRKVGILTFNTQPPQYNLHPDVHLIQADIATPSVNTLAALRNNLKRQWILRGWFKKMAPTAVISFTEEVNVVVSLAALGRRFRLILSDRIHPDWFEKHPIWRFLKQKSYRLADVLVVQTHDVKKAYTGLKVPIIVINNPLLPSSARVMDYEKRIIIAIGRLDIQKNYTLLIDAFSKIDATGWTLQIFGEGSQKTALNALIQERKLEKRVLLRGATDNVFGEMTQSSIFVLSSLAEGYPNVLIEAMSVGLAVISTDCPSGPAEIIEHGQNGLIVPNNNATALSDALQTLIDSPTLRQTLGQSAINISEKLDIKSIIKQWEALL